MLLLVSRKNLCFCNNTQSSAQFVSRNTNETFDIPGDPRGVSRSLPNASFAFTRVSLIACIPLVTFPIFLQKFSSLSGISTGACDNGEPEDAFTEVSRCTWCRGSHTVIPPGSRALPRTVTWKLPSWKHCARNIDDHHRPPLRTDAVTWPSRSRRREMSILPIGAKP